MPQEKNNIVLLSKQYTHSIVVVLLSKRAARAAVRISAYLRDHLSGGLLGLATATRNELVLFPGTHSPSIAV